MHSPLNKIKLIVKDKIGLDSSTIGDSTIDKIIQYRMRQCNIDDFEEYYTLVSTYQDELSELLEVAVIPETWFFRDTRPFEIIYKKIKQQLNDSNLSHIKILSIPSSTGEEPYSIAMYLIDKGIPESVFSIDAVDISTRAIQCAEQGIYGNNSFRGKDFQDFQKKHFTKDGDFYKINPNISEKIKFYRLNILQGDPTIKHEFDFVLCRNLLIYFDIKTKLVAFKTLNKFLKDDGYLFIGHSEFGSIPTDIFQNTGFEKAFALIKHSHPDFKAAKTIETYTPSTRKPQKTKAITQKTNFSSLIQQKTTPSSPTATINNEQLLIQVRQLADSAKYDQADTLCHQFMDENGETSESLFLLGLIANSQNKNEIAESLLRKSLFLDPKHYEALIHLSLLLEQNGDQKNADLFKKRADRAHKAVKNKT